MPELFRYNAYGLALESNRAIPFLLATAPSARVDVSIDFRGTRPFVLPPVPSVEWYASPQRDSSGESQLTIRGINLPDGNYYVRLNFGAASRFAEFTLDGTATHVWVSWRANADLTDVGWLFLRPVMAMLLWLRGITCLHASVVVVNRYAIAFVGSNGAGKSSLAAAFAQQGFGVLADDVAVIVEAENRLLVQPTYPTLALWEPTAQAVLGATDLPHLWAGEEKRYVSLSEQETGNELRFASQALPPGAIYFLGARRSQDDTPLITRVAPAEGLVRLIANRFSRQFARAERQVHQFDLLSHVAEEIPLRQLDTPNNLPALPAVCDAVLNDLSQLGLVALRTPQGARLQL